MSGVLEAVDVHVRYSTAGGTIHAVRGVSLQLQPGESWCLIGASGSGKSSLARALVGLQPLTQGVVRVKGHDVAAADPRVWRRWVQPVFQDPSSALDPRLTIGASIAEAFHLAPPSRLEPQPRVEAVLASVGLAAALADRLPEALSAGQRQRVGLARALAVEPEVLVLDEPVSALDTVTQAQVLNLLLRLRSERQLALVVITHDVQVAAYLADHLAVLAHGSVVEEGPLATVLQQPVHEATRALLTRELAEPPHR